LIEACLPIKISSRGQYVNLHGLLLFASAEYGKVNVLLTVDREFLTNAQRIDTSLMVANPVNWFMEEIEND